MKTTHILILATFLGFYCSGYSQDSIFKAKASSDAKVLGNMKAGSDTIPSQHIKTRKYEGYIFNKNNIPRRGIPKKLGRFTPTPDEIALAEAILKKDINTMNNKERGDQVDGYPKIGKELKKFKRQYFGLINEEGDKIIYINCVMDKELESELSKHLIFIFDGGSYYWNVKVNLRKKILFDLWVNGFA